MNDRKTEWTEKDMKRWRLELIKQRHRELVLSQKDILHDGIIDDDEDMPEIGDADDIDVLNFTPQYEFDAEI